MDKWHLCIDYVGTLRFSLAAACGSCELCMYDFDLARVTDTPFVFHVYAKYLLELLKCLFKIIL